MTDPLADLLATAWHADLTKNGLVCHHAMSEGREEPAEPYIECLNVADGMLAAIPPDKADAMRAGLLLAEIRAMTTPTPPLTARDRLDALLGRLLLGVSTDVLASETGTTDRDDAIGFIVKWVDEDVAAIRAEVFQLAERPLRAAMQRIDVLRAAIPADPWHGDEGDCYACGRRVNHATDCAWLAATTPR